MTKPQPTKKELVHALHKAQKELKTKSEKLDELTGKLATAEAVAAAYQARTIKDSLFTSDEFRELKAMMETLLARLPKA